MAELSSKFRFIIPEKKYARIFKKEIRKSEPDLNGMFKFCLKRATEQFKEGEDHWDYLHASKVFNLAKLFASGYKKVEIQASPCCSICEQHNGEVYSIEEALENIPLPHKDCQNKNLEKNKNGLCLCSYKPFIEETKEETYKLRIELEEGKTLRTIKQEMAKSNPDYQMLSGLCFSEANQLFIKGEDHFHLAQAYRWFSLADYKVAGFKKVEIIANESCEECSELNGRVFMIDEALKTMPIPNPNCTQWKDDLDHKHDTGWCRCVWLPVIEDD
jgi:hypothetical protein